MGFSRERIFPSPRPGAVVNCPACEGTLSKKDVGGLTVDVCEDGCAGLWLDNFELEKVDEQHESAGEALLDVAGDPSVRPAGDEPYSCPRCSDGSVMHRNFFSVKREIEVDECPTCGGVWLDVGELGALRRQYETEEAKRRAAEEEYQRMFGDELDRMRRESLDDLQRARSFAHALRFVLPSYWIPGDQDWGAY